MIRYKTLFVFVFLIHISTGDIFKDMMRSQDPCKDVCTGLQLTSNSNKHTRQVCKRGCRFFNIAKRMGSSITSAKTECHNSCEDSYNKISDQLHTCTSGCNLAATKLFQAKQSEPLIIPQPSELELENDILDPILTNEIDNGIDYNIPETHIKTIPIGNSDDDVKIPGIHPEESYHKESTYHWLDCISKNSGLPRWLLASAIIAGVIFALWVCIAPEHYPLIQVTQPFLVNDVDFSPPPKYELVNNKV